MGQQQLMLVVLGLLIVGVAVAVGISLFRDAAEESNRDAVIGDLGSIASDLLAAYKTPLLTGGAQGDYNNLYTADPVKTLKKKKKSSPKTSPSYYWETDNGFYNFVTVSKDSVVVSGTGREVGKDKAKPVKAQAYIKGTSFRIEILN